MVCRYAGRARPGVRDELVDLGVRRELVDRTVADRAGLGSGEPSGPDQRERLQRARAARCGSPWRGDGRNEKDREDHDGQKRALQDFPPKMPFVRRTEYAKWMDLQGC